MRPTVYLTDSVLMGSTKPAESRRNFLKGRELTRVLGKLGRENIYMLKSQAFSLEKKCHVEEQEYVVIALNLPCGAQTIAGI